MPWWQLKNIADDQRAWQRSYYALPPDACPYCGTPLEVGQTSGDQNAGKMMVRHCPMGDYNWTGGTRIT